MRTVGFLSPETLDEAQSSFEELGVPARELTREIAVAMGFNTEEYGERVTEDVVHTAREALFGSLLLVLTGERSEFDTWLNQPKHADFDVTIEGSERVVNIAWHPAPMDDRVIAATYENEREAAISTLRRIAWGSVYCGELHLRDT